REEHRYSYTAQSVPTKHCTIRMLWGERAAARSREDTDTLPESHIIVKWGIDFRRLTAEFIELQLPFRSSHSGISGRPQLPDMSRFLLRDHRRRGKTSNDPARTLGD